MSPEHSLLSGALSEELLKEERQTKYHNKKQQLVELEPQMMIKRRKPRGPLCALAQTNKTNSKRAEFRMIRMENNQQQTMKYSNCSRQATRRPFAQIGGPITLIGLLVAATLLLAAAANAEHAQHHQDGGYAGGHQAAGYGDQSAVHSKGKKIQIVYIKVPLAKLKPSLPANNNGDYASAGSSSDNTTNYASQHDTSSPASILSSPSMAHADTGKQQQQQQRANGNNNYGGNAGTGGDSSTLHGTQSSATYGANGQSQPEMSSLGNGYQHSASGFAGSGPSSGYGSGTNSFGASVAFSDYPIGPSTGLGQQMYAQQSSNSNSNSNSYDSSNHHHSQSDQQPQNGNALSQAENYTNQKLRQAKKTIIPIVVQVEHAIMENNGAALAANYGNNNINNNINNNHNNNQPQRGNKYSGGRGHRQLGGKRNNRYNNKQNNANNEGYRNSNSLYGASSNEIPLGSLNLPQSDSQYINAANAQDINKITAAINAENAASAAAALAQADMAFGGGVPAYIPNQQSGRGQQQQQASLGQQRPQSQYASQLQSAASALLANTHPVIQAAASGGLASVSKLGAKLGEMIALPSMQVPSSISSIGSALPSALSSITNQMGVQLNQAVQQVAKEHPTAHAFARQVAQHAGLNLPNFNHMQQQQQQQQQQASFQPQQQQVSNGNQQQQIQSASSQHSQSLSPQAQLQNLKLSIGQNLQTAAAQLMGVHQKANAQSAASLLSNPLAALYPQSMNAALKQLSGAAGMQMSGSALSPFASLAPHANSLIDQQHLHAQSSSLTPIQQQQQQQQQQHQHQQLNNQASSMEQQSGQQHQFQNQMSESHQSASSPTSSAQSSLLSSLESTSASGIKQAGKSTLKSKFLSFFQPPKFISNLLSWNDRADDRNDQGELSNAEPTLSGKQTEMSDKQQQKPVLAAGKQDEAVKTPAARNESALPELTSSTKPAPVALSTSNATSVLATTKAELAATSLAPAFNVSSNVPKKN